MSVNLSGVLPAGDGNGLESIVYALRDPKKIHVCICIVSGKKATTDYESGETVTTARIRRIEVILDEDDKVVAQQLMMRALDRRTGHEALPYDLEKEVREAFASAEEPEEEERKDSGSDGDEDDRRAR